MAVKQQVVSEEIVTYRYHMVSCIMTKRLASAKTKWKNA